jgi:phosphatidate cytidylyltransferase
VSLPPGFGRNLRTRVATAAVAIPLLLLVLFRLSAPVVVVVAAAAVGLGLVEFFRLLAARGLRPVRLPGLLLAALVFLEVAKPGAMGVSLWPLAAVLMLGASLGGTADASARVSSAALTLLGAAYLGGLGGALCGLRLVAPQGEGAWRVLFLLATVMFSDACAFFVGHALGRHRLAPALSPGKTREGAAGGLAGGVAAALVVRGLGLPGLSPAHAIVLGLAVSTLGLVGDLVESLLKRWAGVKDSGTLFPGHGGMLDRLDSLLFGAPVLYYYFVFASRNGPGTGPFVP